MSFVFNRVLLFVNIINVENKNKHLGFALYLIECFAILSSIKAKQQPNG